MGIVAELSSVLILFSAVALWLLNEDRRENGGLYFWVRNRILASGAQATGVVLDQSTHSPGWQGRRRVQTVELVLEATLGGQTARRVLLRYRLTEGAMTTRVAAGNSVPLRYDTQDPSRVLIDWPSIFGSHEGPTREQRDADHARQEALLNEKR